MMKLIRRALNQEASETRISKEERVDLLLRILTRFFNKVHKKGAEELLPLQLPFYILKKFFKNFFFFSNQTPISCVL